jgi:hypothetical protein
VFNFPLLRIHTIAVIVVVFLLGTEDASNKISSCPLESHVAAGAGAGGVSFRRLVGVIEQGVYIPLPTQDNTNKHRKITDIHPCPD